MTSLVARLTTVSVSQTTERRIYSGSVRKGFKWSGRGLFEALF